MKKWFLAVVALILLLSFAFGCATKPAPTTAPTIAPTTAPTASPTAKPSPTTAATIKIRYAHQFPITGPEHQSVLNAAKLLSDGSNGRIILDIHPSGELYTEQNMPDAIITGAVDMTNLGDGAWGPVTREFELGGLAFLHAGRAAQVAAWKGDVGKLADAALLKTGVKLVSQMPFLGGESWIINTKRVVEKPEDTKGLLLRAYNKAQADLEAAWGATPTILAAGDMYLAIQRGTIDGTSAGSTTISDRKLYEVAKYATNLGMIQTNMQMILCNLKVWNSLSPADQQLMKEVWDKVADAHVAKEPALLAELLVFLKTKLDYREVKPENLPLWQKVSMATWNDYLKAAPNGQAWIDAAKKYNK